MEIRAHLRYLRIAPRKVRLVIDLVRGLPIDKAVDQLNVLPKQSSLPILKLLNSAVANAEHNFKLERHDLYIKTIIANEGPRLKRYRPRAFGRAAEIQKRMSHVTVILEDRKKTAAPKKDKEATTVAKEAPTVARKSIAATPSAAKVSAPAKRAPKKSSTTKERRRAAEDSTIARRGDT